MSVSFAMRRARARALVAASIALAALVAAPGRSPACDVCAIYSATDLREGSSGLSLGIAEQFTHFGTLQQNGREVDNPAGQRLDSSITQLFASYYLTPDFGLQLDLPIIARSFRRPEGDSIRSSDVSGVGDLSLLASYRAYSDVTETSVLHLTLLAGLKLPSGDSSRLAEELEEEPEAEAARPAHAGHELETGVPSGIHGHDLTLGSGSVDGIVGGYFFWSWRRAYLTLAAQYAIRSEGSFDYQFANDLTWIGGPGYFVLLDHRYSLGAQAVLSGETKGNDTLNGEKGDDTAITALYFGPGVTFTWGRSLGAEVAVDLPVLQHNTALQILPDVRVRAALSWRF